MKGLKGRVLIGTKGFIEKVKGPLKEKETIKEIPRVESFAGRPGLDEIFGQVVPRESN